jgi:hypothetical protein
MLAVPLQQLPQQRSPAGQVLLFSQLVLTSLAGVSATTTGAAPSPTGASWQAPQCSRCHSGRCPSGRCLCRWQAASALQTNQQVQQAQRCPAGWVQQGWVQQGCLSQSAAGEQVSRL